MCKPVPLITNLSLISYWNWVVPLTSRIQPIISLEAPPAAKYWIPDTQPLRQSSPRHQEHSSASQSPWGNWWSEGMGGSSRSWRLVVQLNKQGRCLDIPTMEEDEKGCFIYRHCIFDCIMLFTVWAHAWIHMHVSVCPCVLASCGEWCAPTEWSPCPALYSHLVAPSWHNSPQCPLGAISTEGPYACIPPQLWCFSLGPLTARITLTPSHGVNYERYVVCKLLSPPHFRHQLHSKPQSVSSLLSHTCINTQDGG